MRNLIRSHKTSTEEAIGFAVIFLFIGLAWTAFQSGTFNANKAMLMALTGIPLGLLAPVCLRRDNT